jgi:hypothetical protein
MTLLACDHSKILCVGRTSRTTTTADLLAWVNLYPFRCNCGSKRMYRFGRHSMRSMLGPAYN